MEKKTNYQLEAEAFDRAFERYKDKRIVLYGIGRKSASLIPVLQDYHFVGLMDRDPENIGKIIYGLPVLSREEAEEKADLIVINTPTTYWQVIYRRIREISLPVFFTNGEKAYIEEVEDNYSLEPYWKISLKSLEERLEEYDIISFDIFDTLITRKTYVPQDVFEIIDERLREELGLDIDFVRLRYQAAVLAKEPESELSHIYEALRTLTDLPPDVLSHIERVELETEERAIIPREEMLTAYRKAEELGKEIFLLSDMYLPEEFLQRILKKAGIEIARDHLWISGPRHESKSAGAMWRDFKENVVKHRRALHVGDNCLSDKKMPEEYGIDAFLTWGGVRILKKSSVAPIVDYIDTFFDRNVMGLITGRLFNSPFSLHETKGKVVFSDFYLLGYCIWGPVIYTFLMWLIRNVREDKAGEVLFFARDGYFLSQDYEYLAGRLCEDCLPKGTYLEISRRAIAVASISCREDFEEVAKFPYSGAFQDYMKDRFDVCVSEITEEINREQINAFADFDKLKEWMLPYEESIRCNIQMEKESYRKYFDSLGVAEKFAVVDTGYWGNTQNYLSRFLDKKFTGYYFYANKTEENLCNAANVMIPCFQAESDEKASASYLYKRPQFIESVLTAPHGMFRKMDGEGRCIYDVEKGNQRHFKERIQINEGVLAFIDDILECMGSRNPDRIAVNPSFADRLFGIWFDGHSEFSDEIKASFFWDDGMVQKREVKIFE